MLKVNNRNTNTSVSIVDFEQVNIYWVHPLFANPPLYLNTLQYLTVFGA